MARYGIEKRETMFEGSYYLLKNIKTGEILYPTADGSIPIRIKTSREAQRLADLISNAKFSNIEAKQFIYKNNVSTSGGLFLTTEAENVLRKRANYHPNKAGK